MRAIALRKVAVAHITVLEDTIPVIAGAEYGEHQSAVRKGHRPDTSGGATNFSGKYYPNCPAFNEPHPERPPACHGVTTEIALREFNVGQISLNPSAAVAFILVTKRKLDV